MRPLTNKLRAFLPLFAGVFLSDCVSKRVAVDQLTAMGLSAGAASRWVFAALATAMLVGVAVWLFRTRSDQPVLFTAVALVAGGALGNLVDRLRWDRGVVDFIDIGIGDTRFWIFNVADAAICLGAVLLWLATRPGGAAPVRSER